MAAGGSQSSRAATHPANEIAAADVVVGAAAAAADVVVVGAEAETGGEVVLEEVDRGGQYRI